MRSWIAASIVRRMSSPGLGALGVDDADRLAEGVVDDLALAVGAVQRLLVRLLEPAQAVVVGPDAPEHLRGQRALRIGAARLDDGADPLDPQAADLLAARRVELAPR